MTALVWNNVLPECSTNFTDFSWTVMFSLGSPWNEPHWVILRPKIINTIEISYFLPLWCLQSYPSTKNQLLSQGTTSKQFHWQVIHSWLEHTKLFLYQKSPPPQKKKKPKILLQKTEWDIAPIYRSNKQQIWKNYRYYNLFSSSHTKKEPLTNLKNHYCRTFTTREATIWEKC